jgi:hypothetical protein
MGTLTADHFRSDYLHVIAGITANLGSFNETKL